MIQMQICRGLIYYTDYTVNRITFQLRSQTSEMVRAAFICRAR